MCWGVIALGLALGMLHIFRGDLLYETDIARDMLLLDEMVEQRKIAFIGGRSSIPGVFHGPAYYWLVLPFFALFQGNPVVVSFFWLALYWLFLSAFYMVGKKVHDENFALISTTFLVSLTAFIPKGFTHTVLANFLIVPCLYFLYAYKKEQKVWQLGVAAGLMGLLVQFQMAFGVPVLLCLSLYALVNIVRNRRWTHLFAFLALFIPLSTFLVFDLRHNFIQSKSVVEYLQSGSGASNFEDYLSERVISLLDSFSVLVFPNESVRNIVSMVVLATLLVVAWKNARAKKSQPFLTLGLLVVFGFWLITIPFKGIVWAQYYRPLLPVIVFCLTYILLMRVPKKVGFALLALIVGSNMFFSVRTGMKYWHSSPIDDELHWKFYRQMTHDIFTNSQGESFGYFVFSPDQYGYQGKYALKYFARAAQVDFHPYEKLPLTYLVIAPNDHKNPWANEDFWQAEQVRIDREPNEEWTYPAGYTVKKFSLSEEEVRIKADPHLLDGIHFR